MSIIKSQLDTRAAEFKENQALMSELLCDLRAKVATVKQGGGDRARERHLARGKLLPRDRIDALLDPGAPF